MLLIDELRAEHDLIDRVAGSLLAFVGLRARGEADPADGPRFMEFFRQYAGHFHHAREEDTLFVSLTRDAELPGERGPIKVLLDDHARMAGLLDGIEPLIGAELRDASDRERLKTLATEYTHALWHHIDAENSVLLPESARRLRQHGVHELPSRPMTPGERDAMAAGEDLLARYPPLDDPGVFRGDGCVMCPAFVDSCRGLEHEWWNAWEWDEFEDHLASE
jgi:hemerythrin-like domain-containing protein